MASPRWILRRKHDGRFFCDAYSNEQRKEWINDQSKARVWLVYESCCAAAQTWLAIKGEALEVINLD